MIPCPDCRNLHLHAVHCPNPEPLPKYSAAQSATATVFPIEPRTEAIDIG